jgi:hypothetical protein
MRTCIAALATERYRRDHGRWPDALADLVPAYLAEFPVDPYDGQPLRMRRLADKIVIYSVGSDRKDDGGKLDRKKMQDVDLGFELWDVAKRRRPAPARPPTPSAP